MEHIEPMQSVQHSLPAGTVNRKEAKASTQEENQMSETKNFFGTEGNNSGSNAGWGAGVGGLIGAAIGNGGGGLFGGNNRETATLDQVDSRFNALQGQLNANQVEDRITDVTQAVGGSTAALGLGLASVKDAIINGNAQTQLALCGLGHSMQAGFASVNQTTLLEGARTRELAQQTEINRLLALTAQQHSDAGHSRTQVLLNQVISAK